MQLHAPTFSLQSAVLCHAGLPFVDAAMRELGATGYMNNRGRQNVANLFAKARRPSSIRSRSTRAVSSVRCAFDSLLRAGKRDGFMACVTDEKGLLRVCTWTGDWALQCSRYAPAAWAHHPVLLRQAGARNAHWAAPASCMRAQQVLHAIHCAQERTGAPRGLGSGADASCAGCSWAGWRASVHGVSLAAGPQPT